MRRLYGVFFCSSHKRRCRPLCPICHSRSALQRSQISIQEKYLADKGLSKAPQSPSPLYLAQTLLLPSWPPHPSVVPQCDRDDIDQLPTAIPLDLEGSQMWL